MKKALFSGKPGAAFLALVLLFGLVAGATGQDAREEAKKLQRPKDCGISDYDAFKNASFNLLGEVKKSDINYDKIKTDIAGYLEGDKQATVDGVKSDINRLKSLNKSMQVMDDRVKKLTQEGNDLLQNAKNVKPVTKVKAATSNTKTSIKAVDVSKDLMKEMGGTIEEDITKLKDKVTALGGSVEEEE